MRFSNNPVDDFAGTPIATPDETQGQHLAQNVKMFD